MSDPSPTSDVDRDPEKVKPAKADTLDALRGFTRRVLTVTPEELARREAAWRRRREGGSGDG